MNTDKPLGVESAVDAPTDRVPLLEVEHVSREFSLRRGFMRPPTVFKAVDDVSFTLRRGETLGLVGESGCGKSTLARMIVRLLAVSSGQIRFEGQDICAAKPNATALLKHEAGQGILSQAPTWAMCMQMVFQDPFSSLNPRVPVGYSISEPLLAAGIPKAERMERVATMLERVGLLPEHAKRYPHAFSGGQRQRLAIARAIITPPSLVVCDEAVSALDASVQAQVLNVLKDVQDAFGLSYLFISHDLAVVGHMSERIAVMYLGRIVEMAPNANIFSRPLHPYTQALLESVLVHDPENPHLPESLQGELPSLLVPPTGCAFHPRCSVARPMCREEAPRLCLVAEGHYVACHQLTSL